MTTRRALVIGLFFLFVVVVLRVVRIEQYFSLDYLRGQALFLRTLVDTHYAGALAMYACVYVAIIACAVPVVGPLTLIGGFLFGTLSALMTATVAMTVGATTSFLLIRYLFASTVAQRFAAKREKFAQKVKQYGSTYILTLNLLTVVPFFVISTLAALTEVSIWAFVWTSAVGSFPMLAVYAFAGRKFAEITSLGDIFSPSLIFAFVLLALLSVIPMLVKRMQYVNEL